MVTVLKKATVCMVFALVLALPFGAAYASPLQATSVSDGHAQLTTQAKTKVSTVTAAQVKKAKALTFLRSPYSHGFTNGKYSDFNSEWKGKTYSFGSFQNFAYAPDNKYVFATNIAYKNGYVKGEFNTGLLCYTLNGKKATFLDGEVLRYYGHSDVLAVTQEDLNEPVYQVWVAKSDVKKPKTKDEEYGRDIERITYQVTDTGIKKVDAITLTSFAYARVVENGSVRKSAKFEEEKPNPVRVSAAANQEANRIAFRLRFEQGWGCRYVIYDLAKLNALLDAKVASGETSFPIANAKYAQLSNTKYFNTPGDGFQSFDVDAKNLYVSGWTKDTKAKYSAGIYRVPYRNVVDGEYTQTKVVEAQDIRIEVKKGSEIEGIKIAKQGNKIAYYFDTTPYGPGLLRDGQVVYRVVR